MKKIAVLVLLTLCFSGCILVPILDSFNKSGLTEDQRTAKLPVAVKEFQDAVFWGEVQLALKSVLPQSRKDVQRSLQRFPGEDRVVESKMVSAEYGEEAYNAEVVVETKSYKKDSLVVRKRKDLQRWEFHIGKGWQLLELKQMPA